MTLLCKQKALYVKACIIVNGIPDYHGDTLNSEDIKRIFTTFNNMSSFEIYHNEIPVPEISLLENYISQTDETINGTVVPRGSWMTVIRVDNPSIKAKLLNNDFGGVSLNNRVQGRCSTGLSGNIQYSDLRDAECVIPVYISFVEEPANMVGLHIMSYDVYIRKSGKMNIIEELKNIISRAESSSDDEPIVQKSAIDSETAEDNIMGETITEETDDDGAPVIVKEANIEEEEDDDAADEDDNDDIAVEEEDELDQPEQIEPSTTDDEDVVVEKEAEASAEADAASITEEAETIEDDDEPVDDVMDYDEEINNIKAQLEELKEIIKEIEASSEPEEVIVEESVDEPVITKSAKIEIVDDVDSVPDFYARTNRDPITGKRIRGHSKILN